ncbi:MAG TPA: sigma-54 dependent transcriptional regulator [Terriglobales bacterium]|nr:sigma-54 dependent transcriptional regulator [Terriglobales bacterium]
MPESSYSRHILLVDPDEVFGHVLQQVLGTGYSLRQVSTVVTGISLMDASEVDVALLNLDLQNGNPSAEDPLALVRLASERDLAPPVIAYGWDTRRKKAIEAFQHGAVDFLEQPLDVQALKFALDAAYRRATLTRELGAVQKLLASSHVEGLLGNSKAMARVNEVIRKVAGVFTNVLITGESGTGKGVVARAIHNLSPRANKPFVAFSACALPESLIEDELFGHEKGAFTGAIQSRRGRFEEAKGGTIFLDEIGDLALPLQAKLLRVLQERNLERLGSNVPQPIDVRVICATSRNLEKMMQEGTFREDLYFRISVVRVHTPALRERAEDIPLLAEYFLNTFAKAHKKQLHGLTLGFLHALSGHSWPGNVRELQNVIERSLVLADGNERLGVKDLPQELQGFVSQEELPEGSFHEALRAFKRELVRSALRMHDGNKLQAARELRISRCYLHRLLNQLNITEALAGPINEEDYEETPPPEVPVSRGGARNLRIARVA